MRWRYTKTFFCVFRQCIILWVPRFLFRRIDFRLSTLSMEFMTFIWKFKITVRWTKNPGKSKVTVTYSDFEIWTTSYSFFGWTQEFNKSRNRGWIVNHFSSEHRKWVFKCAQAHAGAVVYVSSTGVHRIEALWHLSRHRFIHSRLEQALSLLTLTFTGLVVERDGHK